MLPDNATCLSCGYSLKHLKSCRCPECGTPFLPTVRGSYGPRRSWVLVVPPSAVYFFTFLFIAGTAGGCFVLTWFVFLRRVYGFEGLLFKLVLGGILSVFVVFMTASIWRAMSRG